MVDKLAIVGRNQGMCAPAFSAPKINDGRGLSKREYAAIMLRVPDSGIDWLDDMIKHSRKLEIPPVLVPSVLVSRDTNPIPGSITYNKTL